MLLVVVAVEPMLRMEFQVGLAVAVDLERLATTRLEREEPEHLAKVTRAEMAHRDQPEAQTLVVAVVALVALDLLVAVARPLAGLDQTAL